MTKTAWMTFNPRCGTARKTLAILEEEGFEVTQRRYLEEPLSRDEIAHLLDKGGMTARDLLRAKEPLARDLGLTQDSASDDEILDAMVEHPILLNRPIVETQKGALLARPQDEVRRIL
ncbi:arsenate reductase (glutaredoxin) [Sphingomicrobium astaxanthinifaciens]|uniref:arsenate reductase (glutaredoxin) n=1 Tax=Sphingomicrobium astaxanthinifaciens TaxID=1227949 RepID=UPI001FCC7645|nr:arsenate reductase (glutaredoxin) [Sphingomicrobium astaxanthinifaciens]MCJ7421798.1 arsenate reductase (glutaredoxin) [Sphingomicrobium astaxanthinifaciens]